MTNYFAVINMNRPIISTGAFMLAGIAGACARESAPVFSAPEALSAPTAVGTAPNFAVSPKGARAAAWVSAPDGGTDGRLYISVGGAPAELRDSLGPIEAHGESPPKIAYSGDGALNALYVVAKVVPGRRFPLAALRFVRSDDGGKTWSSPVTVTDASEFGSNNFHALHTGRDGSMYVAWLDGRQGKSAAYMTRSDDGGKTWAPNVRIAAGEACPCCRTAIATTKDKVYIAWRSVAPGDIRDVVVASSSDRGATWSAPARVHADNWVFPGCPHAGPAMQADEQGNLSIAWWTGKEGSAGVYYARSENGGSSWSTPIAMGTAQFSKPAHVQLSHAPGGKVVVAWDDGTLKTPQVVVRVSSDLGRSFGPPSVLSGEGRAATFPVLAVTGNQVTVAWAEQSAEAAAHQAAHAPNMKDPKAVKGLHAVGESQIIVRAGNIE
ncbi:MAG TPA: sialidase family protein [Gemmatimonadaceae bacterium]|nr:sialidase family protein [Gemmatimonadaceae bacterium]